MGTDAYAHLPPATGVHIAYGFGQSIGMAQYLLAVVVEHLSFRSHLPLARGSEDKGYAEFFFHLLEAQGKRRLADIEFLCGLAYLAFLHDGAEILHVFQIHSMPPCCMSSG